MNSEIKQQADLFIECIRAYRRSAIISPNERDATISAIWGVFSRNFKWASDNALYWEIKQYCETSLNVDIN
jgi:hypothetical protein